MIVHTNNHALICLIYITSSELVTMFDFVGPSKKQYFFVSFLVGRLSTPVERFKDFVRFCGLPDVLVGCKRRAYRKRRRK